jgi:hypothetical protein
VHHRRHDDPFYGADPGHHRRDHRGVEALMAVKVRVDPR